MPTDSTLFDTLTAVPQQVLQALVAGQSISGAARQILSDEQAPRQPRDHRPRNLYTGAAVPSNTNAVAATPSPELAPLEKQISRNEPGDLVQDNASGPSGSPGS